MSMIVHSSDANEIYVRENFTMHELRCRSADKPGYFILDDVTLDLLQYIRSATGQPIRVTSTLRTPIHNTAIGGVSNSRHLVGRAIDFQFIDSSYHSTFITELYGGLEEELREFGLGGLGLYDTFFHIDNRENESVIWDNRTFVPNDQPSLPKGKEDGIFVNLNPKKWIFLAFLGVLIYKK